MFGSMMGDGFEDLMGGHMRQMQNMMNSFFGGNPLAPTGRSRSMSLMPFNDGMDPNMNSMMSPFGFPSMGNMANMGQMMRSMSQMPNDPNCHSFSSSSVMTMTTGPDGKPQVYQASQSSRSGPGGVRETKKSVCDSRSGVKKLSIGHHIGERAHIKEKEQNVYSGQLEENEEYVNLDEEEADQFNREWQTKTQHFRPRSSHQAIGYHRSSNHTNPNEYLALPPAPSAEPEHSLKQESQQKKKDHRSKPYNKRKEKKNQE
ncbi:myeloid leukemia factor isoform X2 [Planococcus citri]|uniref:myeloid leukemia factor isoform X2 n=1 Tax=Planococcus citri TaxID=170843 RepID=UPI0031F9BC9F